MAKTLMRGAWLLLAFAGAACVAIILPYIAERRMALLADCALAVAAMWLTRRRSRLAKARRSKRAWISQVLYPAVWAVSPLVLAVGGPREVALAARLVALGCAAVAWWLTSHAVDTWSRVRLVIDGGLAAGAALVVGWDPLLSGAWSEAGGGAFAVGTFACVLGSVWVATLGVGLAVTEMRGWPRVMPMLFAAALLVQAWSEATWARGGIPWWSLSWVLVLAAATSYRGTSGRHTIVSTAPIYAYAPYVVASPAVVSLVIHAFRGEFHYPELPAALAMVMLLMLRQHVTLAENHNLVRRLAETEKALRHQATHDHLTGLAGRAIMWERLERAQRFTTGEPFAVAVVFVDLDGFKEVNDGYGHAAGDHVLVEIARRLGAIAETQGSHCLAVRLSGDEFALYLERDAAVHSATVAQEVVESIKLPLDIGAAVLNLSASVGVAGGMSGSVSPSSLLRAADVAMYQIKHAGKGGVAVAAQQ